MPAPYIAILKLQAIHTFILQEQFISCLPQAHGWMHPPHLRRTLYHVSHNSFTITKRIHNVSVAVISHVVYQGVSTHGYLKTVSLHGYGAPMKYETLAEKRCTT